jgi:hypothetical protein
MFLALKDQGPFKRFIRNFLITRNAWGLFHINSHVSQGTGKEKVSYNTKPTAMKSVEAMNKKHNTDLFRSYRCAYCGKYHIGKNNYRRQQMV